MAIVAAVLLLSCCCPGISAGETQASKPNILFIAVDDLRPELGCYGRDYIKSPNIDRIARGGDGFQPRLLPAGGLFTYTQQPHDRDQT